jgi:EAL domain-containing protein (putative c-di-GMP-specific phosphodiesterase class I)
MLWIKKALHDSGMLPHFLKLEITESVFIKDFEHVAEVIHQINSLGVQISIDDFGKGYSSLIHLLHLPIAEIKMDKNFIRGIDQHDKQAFFIKSIIDLAHGLQLNVVAEGIETPGERDLLLQLGCDELQGFLFSPPVSHVEMGKLLSSREMNGGRLLCSP